MEMYSKFSHVIGEKHSKSAWKQLRGLCKGGNIRAKILKKEILQGHTRETYSRKKGQFSPQIYF